MPRAPDPGAAADLAACRAAIREGSKSFHAASRLLPDRVRGPVLALYAFCRVADDAVDLSPGKAAAVEALRHRLARAYAGQPAPMAADRAFARMVRVHDMPRALPDALIEGFAWDAEGRRYADFEALTAYCARVASTVGAMMAVLMGVRDAGALARACDLGVAMQLTNIARDVGEDAAEGRLYLPLDWLADAGVDADAFLADPRPSSGIAAVTARLLDAADALYARSEAGIARLPRDCRPAILAARLIYAEIGAEIRAHGCDSVSVRARTSTARKIGLAARAMIRAPMLRAGDALAQPPLGSTRFLVEAAARAPAPGRLSERVTRVLSVFEALAARDRALRGTI